MVLRTAVISTVVALSLIGISAASDSQAAIRKPISIPAQELGSALQSLAKARGFQVVYLSDAVDSLHTGGVKGDFTADEALRQLLSGTGLSYRHLDDATVTVFPATEAGSGSSSPSRPPASSPSNTAPRKQESQNRLRLAQAEQSAASQSVGDTTTNKDSADAKTEVVTVTGSRLTQVSVQGPQEVKVYTREAISKSGQQTVMDFLNTLPAVSTIVSESGYDTVGGAGAVRLRGLPVGSTLVLLDGRSVEGAGTGQSHGNPFDLNSIPNAAVERIEIVPEASSAVYGSDAIGGVVNIILRKNFDGGEVSGSVGEPTDGAYSDTSGSLAWGKTFSRGNVSVIANYQLRGSLATTERELTSNQDYRRYGGVDERGSNCAPGNVRTLDGSNLPGLASSYAAIPTSSTGILTPADFLATSGTKNLCSYGSFGPTITPATRRLSYLAHANYELTDAVQAFFEGMYTEVAQEAHSSPRSVYSQVVPADNPFNPFGVPVAVDYRFASEGLYGFDNGNTYFDRILGGFRGSLGARWDWEVAAWQSEDHGKLREANTIDTTALSAALANTDPAQSVNLFSSGAPATAAVLAAIVTDPPVLIESRLHTVNGFVRGSVFDLPAGPLKILIGGEYNRMKQSMFVPGEGQTVPDSFSRNSKSGFTELNIPILAGSGAAGTGSGQMLAVSFAGRYDDYSDFGGKFTPQGGIEFRPIKTLLLRASYSKAFKAPDLRTVYSSPIHYTGVDLAPDPFRGGEVYAGALQFGGNRNIKPQTGNSRSFGLVWSSQAIESLQVSVTDFRITEENRITTPSQAELLAHPEVFTGRVVRAAPTAEDVAKGYLGRVISIDASSLNYGQLVVEGVDLDIDYKFPTPIGTFSPTLAVTEIYKYDSSLSPGTAPENRLGRASDDAFATRWKGTLAIGYSQGPFSGQFGGRYISSYLDYDRKNTLGNYWLFDASAQFDAGKMGLGSGSFWHGAYVSAAVINLFDKKPQFTDYYGTGYDPRMTDIRGRFATVTAGLRW